MGPFRPDELSNRPCCTSLKEERGSCQRPLLDRRGKGVTVFHFSVVGCITSNVVEKT